MATLRAIQARLNREAAASASRLMAGSTDECVMELLQNARRSGAEAVHIQLGDDWILVGDDGDGMENPNTLFEFGTSGWNAQRQEREKPAGIGFFALAGREVLVRSRPAPRRGKPSQAWMAAVGPAHFDGRTPIRPRETDEGPLPHGTAVSFTAGGIKRWAIEALVTYFPLPVYIDDEPVKQKLFIDEGTRRVAPWNGLEIAICEGGPEENPSVMSFHGSIARLGTRTLRGRAHARVEVDHEPDRWLTRPGYTNLRETRETRALRDHVEALIDEHERSGL